MWACIAYYSSPSFYRSLRDSEVPVRILPHPAYLRKLSLFGAKSGFEENDHELFLKETFSVLKSKEKIVNPSPPVLIYS